MTKKIGILTGGGDCPGLNAAIRGFVKKAASSLDNEIIGFQDGFLGVIENRYVNLSEKEASGIISLGGTILGTSNKANPFKHFTGKGASPIDISAQVLSNLRNLDIEVLVTIGGDGTQQIAYQLHELGVNVIGIPKTIDNDLCGTDQTFGFDTAFSIATEALDRIHTTAQAHHRIMLVEVMGRYAGWIALHSGVASGSDIILLPEFPYNLQNIIDEINKRIMSGRHFTVVVVSEGAKEQGHDMVVREVVAESTDPLRLGGIAYKLAKELEDKSGVEARATVLGHIQRGGTPTAYDRILATQFGAHAAELILKKKYGRMVSLQSNQVTSVNIKETFGKTRVVTKDTQMFIEAQKLGVCFGL